MQGSQSVQSRERTTDCQPSRFTCLDQEFGTLSRRKISQHTTKLHTNKTNTKIPNTRTLVRKKRCVLHIRHKKQSVLEKILSSGLCLIHGTSSSVTETKSQHPNTSIWITPQNDVITYHGYHKIDMLYQNTIIKKLLHQKGHMKQPENYQN